MVEKQTLLMRLDDEEAYALAAQDDVAGVFGDKARKGFIGLLRGLPGVGGSLSRRLEAEVARWTASSCTGNCWV
jgi:hypothetical protein